MSISKRLILVTSFTALLIASCKTNRSGSPDPIFVEVSADGNPSLGAVNAPVTLIVFSDFECSYCYNFYKLIEGIREDYIQTGKVRYVYRDYPLEGHDNAFSSAVCANCALEQNQYWEMHGILFENQGDLNEDNYKKWALELGLDLEAFVKCLTSGEVHKEIENDFAAGKEIGVKGTPTFIINNSMYGGAPPEDIFKKLLDAAIKKSDK